MRKKKWVDPYLLAEQEYLIHDRFQSKNYSQFEKKYLEIGCGLGDFLLSIAKDNPLNLYVGFEKDPTCVANAIKKAKLQGLTNILFMNKNAMNLLEYFEESTFDGMYLLFSDPWPKSGYYKRRLSYRSFLKQYSEILKEEAFLYFKTDNENLFNFTLEELGESNFVIDVVTRDFHKDFNNSYITGYEAKFMAMGMNIYHVLAHLKK